MMNTSKFLGLLIACCMVFADGYAQTAAHITAEIAGLNNNQVRFSYELNNVVYKYSVRAEDGVFAKVMTVPESVLCTLSNAINQQIRILILEPGNIGLTGDVDRFYALNITGAHENDLLLDYKNSLYALPGLRPKATGNEAEDKKARSAFAATQQLGRDSILSAFVKKKGDHVAAAIAVFELYVTYPDRNKAEQNFDLLSAAVKETEYGKRIRTFINAATSTEKGAVAAGFVLPDKDGKQFSLKDFRGKYVLVDFWASWCVPCRKENPNLIKAYQRYKNKGFTIVGLSMDSSRENWITAVQQDQLPWTQLNDPKSTNGKVADVYGVKSLPANFLVGPDGRIIAKNLRGIALEEILKNLLP